jgi:hypothetical protein
MNGGSGGITAGILKSGLIGWGIVAEVRGLTKRAERGYSDEGRYSDYGVK